jgi:hypothetical protein
MQKTQIIGSSFENKLHWQFEFRLLLFTVCTCGRRLRCLRRGSAISRLLKMVDSKPIVGMDVCLLCVLCVFR